jgi:cell division protein FtsN
MAQSRKRKSSRRNSRASESSYPGWLYGVFGLAIGLSVAAAIWFSDRRSAPETIPVARVPASLERSLDDNGETPKPAAQQQADVEKPVEKSRFDFYEMLPNFEVVVPEEEQAVAVEAAVVTQPKEVIKPGIYVLQAGSFTTHADADRRRAELALQGIESNIQKVTIDDKTYHRVRIGPTDDLDELNVLRSRLRAAKIDALRIRLGD